MSRPNEYEIVLEPETEGGFSVFVPDLKGCVTQGETREEAQAMAKEAIELYLDVLDEKDWPPVPADLGRLSPQAERMTIEVDLPSQQGT